MTTTATATANAVSCDVTQVQPKLVRGYGHITQELVDHSIDWDNDWMFHPNEYDWCAFDCLEDEATYIVDLVPAYWANEEPPYACLVGRWDADRACVVEVPEPLRTEVDAFVRGYFSPGPEEQVYDPEDYA